MLPVLVLVWLLLGAALLPRSEAFVGLGVEGTSARVLRTLNGGRSWELLVDLDASGEAGAAAGGGHVLEHVASMVGSDGAATVGSAGALFRAPPSADVSPYTEVPVVWEFVDTGVPGTLRKVLFHNATHGLVVGDTGVVLLTADSGASWARAATFSYTDLYDVSFEGSVGFAVGSVGMVARSTDWGRSWTTQAAAKTSASGRNLYAVAVITPSNANTVVAVGGFGSIVRTADAGATWSAVPPPSGAENAQLVAIAYSPDFDNVVVAGSEDTLLVSSDQGASFSRLTLSADPDRQHFLHVTVGDAGLGVLASRRKIITSRNGGRTWRAADSVAVDANYISCTTIAKAAVFKVTPERVIIAFDTSQQAYTFTVLVTNDGSDGLKVHTATFRDPRLFIIEGDFNVTLPAYSPGALRFTFGVLVSEYLVGAFDTVLDFEHNTPVRVTRVNAVVLVSNPSKGASTPWIEENWWVFVVVALMALGVLAYGGRRFWRRRQRMKRRRRRARYLQDKQADAALESELEEESEDEEDDNDYLYDDADGEDFDDEGEDLDGREYEYAEGDDGMYSSSRSPSITHRQRQQRTGAVFREGLQADGDGYRESSHSKSGSSYPGSSYTGSSYTGSSYTGSSSSGGSGNSNSPRSRRRSRRRRRSTAGISKSSNKRGTSRKND